MTRWAAWLAAGLVVAALAFAGFRLVGQAVRETPEPDLAAFTSSGQVQANDKLAGDWLRQQAARFAAQATWLTLVGHAMADACSGSGGGQGMFGGGIGASVSCLRTETWYFAIAGDQETDVDRLERILSRTDGWGKFTDVPAGAASPPVLAVTSSTWTGPGGRRPPVGKVGIDLIWVRRKQQLPAAALGSQVAQVNADRVRYLQIRRPDLDAVARKGFGPHRQVVVVSFVTTYFTSSSLTPPPAASTASPSGSSSTGGSSPSGRSTARSSTARRRASASPRPRPRARAVP